MPPESPTGSRSPGFAGRIRAYTEATLSFLYPENCQVCRAARATHAAGYVCDECKSKIKFIEPPFCDRCGRPFEGAFTTRFECQNCRDLDLAFTSARSAAFAHEPLLDVIHQYKYNRAFWFEPFLADLLISRARVELENQWDFLIPIPLHPTREREREFNQAERLATCLSRVTNIPVNSNMLRRIRKTQSQTLLSRDERLINMKNAFALKNEQNLAGGKFVLIDDVFTTGATAGACAKALRAAGAEKVCVWTVARGL